MSTETKNKSTEQNHEDATPSEAPALDTVIVVGAGSAGSVVARRLADASV